MNSRDLNCPSRTLFLFLFLFGAGTAVFCRQSSAAQDLAALQDTFANAAGKAKPAVVHITTVHEEIVRMPQFFFGDPEDFFPGVPPSPRTQRYRMQGAGSGFLFDSKGYVLTNDHVVRNADEIRVILTDPRGTEKTYAGRVIGKDPYLDLAVIKIQAEGPFPFLPLGDSTKVRVGDWAMAIGSPFALGQTVTVGVISAVQQTLVIEGRRYSDLLQTDAAINRGNSGGPLLNLAGEVVGINTAIYSPSGAFAGIGFAIPINEAKEILSILREGKTTRHGWLGIEIGRIDEIIRKRFGLPDLDGALVNRVLPKGPAAQGGLRRGDVIRRMGGQPIASPDDLIRTTAKTVVGSKVSLEVIRDGKPLEVAIRLGERPETLSLEPEEGTVEEKPAPEGSFLWEGVSFEQKKGKARVAAVAQDSKLFGYFLPGDQIEGVNQVAVKGLFFLKEALGKASLIEGVVFDILRNDQPMYISVQAGR